MSEHIVDLINANYGLQKQYPSKHVMQEFIFDNVDVLMFEEKIEVLHFIIDTQGTSGILNDVSDGVALSINKLDMFVLQGVYDMFVKFKDAAGSVESIVFD